MRKFKSTSNVCCDVLSLRFHQGVSKGCHKQLLWTRVLESTSARTKLENSFASCVVSSLDDDSISDTSISKNSRLC